MTVAGPCPLAWLRATHGTSARADHAHSRSAATLNVAVAPAAGISEALFLTVIAHFALVGPTTSTVVDDPQPVPNHTANAAAAMEMDNREERMTGAIIVVMVRVN